MRREQIHKLVLNHIISDDITITPMQSSAKAFVWGAMNYTDEGPALEKLAARFKNEQLAAAFKKSVDGCVEEILKTHGDLEPEDD